MCYSRYCGIIADGTTDREIIEVFVRGCLPVGNIDVIKLGRVQLRDAIDRYWQACSSSGTCGFPGEPADKLASDVRDVLFGAYRELRTYADRDVSVEDLLLLCSDTERVLRTPDLYFEDWAWIIGKIVWLGIEKYYHTMCAQGHDQQSIPTVIPFLPYPSTDILVAAARRAHGDNIPLRHRTARQLKTDLYGTVDLRTLREDELKTSALDFLDENGLRAAYQDLPEIRLLFHYL